LKSSHFDGVIHQEIYTDGDRLVSKVSQPNRKAILEHNAQVRRNPEVLKNSSFGGLELSIPELDYHRLVAANPDLASPDSATRTRAWRAFFYSDAALPYRVRDRVRKPRGL